MRFISDAQRRAVFAKMYPEWLRKDLSPRQKDIVMRYKNRLDAHGIDYDIVDGEPVPVSKLARDAIREKHKREKRYLDDSKFARYRRMRFRDGYVSLVPIEDIIDPTVGLGFHERTVKNWIKQLGDAPVPPLILRPSYLDPRKFTIWDGRHRFAAIELLGRKHVPARIYKDGGLVYPERYKRRRFKGDETKIQKLGEEYKYLW